MKKIVTHHLGVGLSLLLLSCGGTGMESGNPQQSPPPPVAAMESQILVSGTQSGIEEARQAVISSEDQLRALWDEAFSGIDMGPSMPVVDFERYRVVAAFMGMVRSGGHSVTFREITPSRVVVQHARPGRGCAAATVIEFPFAIARTTPFATGPVEFEVVVVEEECK
jgi:hypothetical protein